MTETKKKNSPTKSSNKKDDTQVLKFERKSEIGNAIEYEASETKTARMETHPAKLLFTAIGGPKKWFENTSRIGFSLRSVLNRDIKKRLDRARELGYFDGDAPTPLQLFFTGLDQLKFMIVPAYNDYQSGRGINPRFQYLLRFFDDPMSMLDPTGLNCPRDTIVNHIAQVPHLNATYDLQLLHLFPDGLEELEKQLEQFIDGTHPNAKVINSIIEDADYHKQILEFTRKFRKNPTQQQMRRKLSKVRDDINYVLAEETFGTMPGLIRYAKKLPKSLRKLLHHYREHEVIPREYLEPEVLAYVESRFAEKSA